MSAGQRNARSTGALPPQLQSRISRPGRTFLPRRWLSAGLVKQVWQEQKLISR
jgi:hypothetical protein